MAKPKLALIPAAQGSKFYSVLPSSGVGDFDFTRSGSATRINSQGLIETVANGVSRLNYPLIDGKVVGCPSHLLEPQRTNNLLQSNQFDTTWSVSNASTTSGQIGVGGSLDAWKLESSGSSSSFIFQAISTSAVTTRSIYAKAGSVNWFSINSGGSQVAYFDLSNGVVGTKSSNIIDATMESVGDGWYRCSVEIDSQSNFYVFIANADNSQASNNGDSIYIQYAQLEQGSYPTSYIPTSGSTVTRSAETANGSGDAATFNDSEGVLMAEISALDDDNSVRYISLNDGSTSNRIRFGYTTATNSVRLLVVASTSQVDITKQLSDTSLFNKFAIKYKQNDFALWANGFEIAVDTSGNTPSGLSEFDFDNAAGGDDFYGNTKQLQYYDSALTDSELEQLTSWVSFSDMANGQLYTIE